MNKLQELMKMGLWMPGITFAFDGDDNEGGGGGDDNKGDDKGDKGDKGDKDDKGDSKPETYVLKVDGVDKEFTLEEMKAATTKVSGADEKFRQSADNLKKAEKGTRIAALFGELSEATSAGGAPNQASVKELAGLLGVDIGEFSKSLKADSEDKSKKKDSAEELLSMDKLTPELQTIMKESQAAQYRGLVDKVKKTCEEGVDKDEILSKIIGSVTEDGEKSRLREALSEMLFEDVQTRIRNGEQYGTEMVSHSLQVVRARVKNLGVPAKMSQKPYIPGLGPSSNVPSEVYSEDPIKRVASDDPGYEDNFVKRVMQGVVKASKK